MNSVFGMLEQLYVQGIPTIVFVLILLVILDRLFFRPIAAVMGKRAEATIGALERAKKQIAESEERTRKYEAALQAARLEIYSSRQEDRRKALAERERALEAAREQAAALVKQAQATLAAETEAARSELLAASRTMAIEITDRILAPEPPGDAGGVRA
jgi:F-type H+-transporting ATPase subunit b